MLLRFRRPRYDTGLGFGQVTWPIERGLLVPQGAAAGTCGSRFDGSTGAGDPGGGERCWIRAEVQNFYPLLRGGGRFARIGAAIYAATQLRIHVWITRGFLRSLEPPRPASLAGRARWPAERDPALSELRRPPSGQAAARHRAVDRGRGR